MVVAIERKCRRFRASGFCWI